MDKRILIICGKSASGKDTLLNRVVDELGYKRIISTTTRPKRDGEVDGVDYHFVTEEEFKRKINNGEMLEFRAYKVLEDGKDTIWYYGTEKISVGDDHWVGVLDISGAKAWRNVYKDQVAVMMLTCPDDIRTDRAKKRGSFSELEWNRRLKADTEDFEAQKWVNVVDTVQRNVRDNDLNYAIESVEELMG